MSRYELEAIKKDLLQDIRQIAKGDDLAYCLREIAEWAEYQAELVEFSTGYNNE